MICRKNMMLNGKTLLSAVLVSSLISLSGCGDKAGKTGGQAPESGGLQLRLKWAPTPAEPPNARALTDSPSGNVCEDYDIESIRARLTSADDEQVAAATWECAAHSGRLEGIRAGSGYKVTVDGIIEAEACWQGEALNLEILGGLTTPVEIEMHYLSCSRDLPPPEVASVSPAENDAAVPVNARISATFATPMVVASILAESAFTVWAGAVAVEGEVAYDEASRTATFTPQSDLAANTSFTARISSRVENTNGDTMPGGYTWTFTTGTLSVLRWGEGAWGDAVWGGE
jgi:hypothetical protein